MKHVLLLIVLAFTIITLAGSAQVQKREPTAMQAVAQCPVKIGPTDKIVVKQMKDGTFRGFLVPQIKMSRLATPQPNSAELFGGPCWYAFVGETCEPYSGGGGYLQCWALYWSEACQLAAICVNFYGGIDCNEGCFLQGTCVEGIPSWPIF